MKRAKTVFTVEERQPEVPLTLSVLIEEWRFS